jgi:hypothetical protein
MRNLSEKYNLGLFEHSAENTTAFEKVTPVHDEKKDCDDAIYDDYPVEDGVVFCDFPRQDGTPCIIYNTKGQEEGAKSIDNNEVVAIDSEENETAVTDEVSSIEINLSYITCFLFVNQMITFFFTL